MPDPIRAALDAACQEWLEYPDTRTVKDGMAAAVAAFLRACPVITDLPPGPDRMGFWDAEARERWAAAVEEAAGQTVNESGPAQT